MYKVIARMAEVCDEEGVSAEQVFFYFAIFAVVFIIMTILEKDVNKSVEEIKHLTEILEVT